VRASAPFAIRGNDNDFAKLDGYLGECPKAYRMDSVVIRNQDAHGGF
jgi:hypothetical protein